MSPYEMVESSFRPIFPLMLRSILRYVFDNKNRNGSNSHMHVLRKIGAESAKSFNEKVSTGFFDKYMRGKGIEIGCNTDDCILPDCVGINLTTPGYDGTHIFEERNTFDYLYSSHCLEHVHNPIVTLQEWYRIVKPGGFIVVVVPHMDLYEKKHSMPSRFSAEHKRFYSSQSLLYDIQKSLTKNTYRIRHLKECDAGYDYTLPSDVHPVGQYEIEVVIEKLCDSLLSSQQ